MADEEAEPRAAPRLHVAPDGAKRGFAKAGEVAVVVEEDPRPPLLDARPCRPNAASQRRAKAAVVRPTDETHLRVEIGADLGVAGLVPPFG